MKRNGEITGEKAAKRRLIRVALDVPLSSLFDYEIGGDSEVTIGQRVLVPFGRRQLVGVVLALPEESPMPPDKIKPVLRVLEDVPPLSTDILALLHFCSDYYLYPLGQTLVGALPVRLRHAEPLRSEGERSYRLTAAGRKAGVAGLPKRKVVQTRIVAALEQGACSLAQLRALSPSAPVQLRALLQAGWVEEATTAPTNHGRFTAVHVLTAEQEQVVTALRTTTGYRCFLLHGVTGSGKTETYVHLIWQVLQQGRQVLLLVPEINLTPQLEQYFRSRFPDTPMVSLHSGLSDGVRAQNWLQAQAGRARIVLGTRLAVFTPMPLLGLILVDEEHDASYKQQDGLRYSARDVAIFRARQCDIPVLLGSATPSLESWHNALSGRYTLLQLTQRAVAQAALPVVRCVDVRRQPLSGGISQALIQALERCLARGEQSLLFINRRGYAPVLMCPDCGWLSGCPHCAGKLVLHRTDHRLRCHHCGHQARVPAVCPSCAASDLQPVGLGTQRLEETLRQRFPAARVLRVDRDSTRNRGAWAAMRQQIHEGAADILVGTQILAKGHDFPNLTLVGVVDPDSALYSSDFRAAERLYAQLAQVAGRSGRAGKPGEVLIQTAFPEHPLYRALQTHNFPAWAEQQLAERRQAGFPPYMYQAMLRAEGRVETEVYAFLHRARELAREWAHEVDVYDVVPATLARRAQLSRAQLLVQAATRRALQQFLHRWQPQLERLAHSSLRWALDIDPLEF